jgi:transposase
VELAAFAQQVGASPAKQIVLVLDRAGWHSSVQLRVPDHVHLLFLPPYSPELQPAEHLWPLTNSVLVNRHFATIDELEDAQAALCGVAGTARSHPLDRVVPLVAPADQETTGPETKVV